MRASVGHFSFKLNVLKVKKKIEGRLEKKKPFLFYFVLNFWWVGVQESQNAKLLSENTMSCLYGIFDHCEHIVCLLIIFFFTFLSPKLYGWVGVVRCLGRSPKKRFF